MLARLFLLVGTAIAIPPDTVVVCPRDFLTALEPWIDHRRSQGHHLAIVSNFTSPSDIRSAIGAAAGGGRLTHVVLVGDARPHDERGSSARRHYVPTFRTPARVNIQWGSEPDIATDHWYAELDGDGIADLAIGRLPADTAVELSIIVNKILAYEKSRDLGSWNRQINLVAGLGGFDWLTDVTLGWTCKKLITDGIPPTYKTTMTYASWRSPYCPGLPDFHTHTLQRLNEGCLLWVYMGHGQRTALDRIQTPDGDYKILDANDTSQLCCAAEAPIAVFLSCYTAAYDHTEDCLAEKMLKARGGPVAAVGATRVAMPYGMAVLATSLLEEFFHHQRPTLGEVLLHAKQQLANDKTKNRSRQFVDSVAATLSPHPRTLAAERIEHMYLFHLIGDPLLRLRYPRTIQVSASRNIEAGNVLTVTGKSPVNGIATVELVCRRDRLTFTPTVRTRLDTSDAARVTMNDTYQRANNHRWSSRSVATQEGNFRVALAVPAEAKGACHVRVYVEGKHECAVGATDVYIRRASDEPTASPENHAPHHTTMRERRSSR